MKSFENFNVTSVRQAVLLLEKFQKEKKSAIMVGGGSEILQLMKERVVTPDYVVNLKTIPGLNTIKEERGGIRIGALTTLVEIEEHPTVREKLLILSDGAAEGASPQIRNARIIGGNLCKRSFCRYFRRLLLIVTERAGRSVIQLPATAAITPYLAADRVLLCIRPISHLCWLLSTS